MKVLVVDTETTGFSNGDRIIELALVQWCPQGQHRVLMDTLINPRRAVGASWVHGIQQYDVDRAPDELEVMTEFVSHLDGSHLLVAHNMSFDWRFISAACGRNGIIAPDVNRWCSMKWAKTQPQYTCGKLDYLCSEAGIHLERAHAAVWDTLATCQFLCYIKHGCLPDFNPLWDADSRRVSRTIFP